MGIHQIDRPVQIRSLGSGQRRRAGVMCTGIRLECANGYVAGRTCEFGEVLEYDALFLPVGTQYTAVIGGGPGKAWSSSHAVVGMATFGAMAIMDGVNDAGLMAGAFYFPGQAQFAAAAQTDASRALNSTEVPHYILATCGSIDEALAAIAEITVVDSPVNGWGPVAPPLHYQIIDAQGRHVAVEPTQPGSLQITENPTSAFTNSPDLPFHLLNLTQYMNVSPETLQQSDVFGTTVTATGMGSGGLGLPGDYSPPSRFVRAAFFGANHPTPATTIDGVQELFHLLNAFDIPMGAARVGATSDFTQLTVVRDSRELTYAWRSYADQRIRQVKLGQLIELATAPVRIAITPVTGDQSSIDDVTGQLVDSPVAAA
jgi:choloylglycine hydrolase